MPEPNGDSKVSLPPSSQTLPPSESPASGAPGRTGRVQAQALPAVGLFQRGMRYLQEQGPLQFLRATWGYFIQRSREREAYDSLLTGFPGRLDGSVQAELAFDRSAALALADLFARLAIQVDAAPVLSLYRNRFRKGRYFQFLTDLFTLEQALPQSSTQPGLPILQASALPPASSPRRRKILYVTAQFPSSNNGGGNSLLNFIRLLSRGNDIYLASAFLPAQDQEAYRSVQPYCRSIYRISPWHFSGRQKQIRAWLGDRSMDVVHYEWPQSLYNYDAELGRIQIFTYMEAVSLRILMDLRGLDPLSEPWLLKIAELIPALRQELADSTSLHARVAVTRKDAEFFHKLNPYQEYTVLNHGRNMEEFILPDVQAEPHTLVFVGNYLHYPNVDALYWFLEAIWPAVLREIPDVHLLVVGANPPKEMLALANGSGITVTGSVPDVRPYIQKGSVCIAPLISGAGIRGKLIEYAALQRTFVATSIAATDLVFEDGRDFLLADAPDVFAEKLVWLLKNPHLAKKMGISAQETARNNYDAARLVEFLDSLYTYLEGREAT